MSRPACLAACFLVSMGCGTLYGFSSYAPQLSERLSLSATKISTVGMIGNIATSASGPFAGYIVDHYGFLIPILISSFATFGGYLLIRVVYANVISSMALLCTALVMIGIGASCAFSASVKCAAVNFPDCRGFATSVAMAGYGLSAFVMSSLSRIVASDVEGVLSLLSFLPVTLFIVFGPVVVYNQPKRQYSPGMDDDFIGLVETPRLVDRVTGRGASTPGNSHREIHGSRLLKSSSFWYYALLLGTLAGMGQSYIYTCGYMVKALALNVDEHVAQGRQVAILSLMNCFGRFASGIISDGLVNHLKVSRSWALLVAGLACLGAQIGGNSVTTLERLWIPTSLAGFFYGCIFGAYPGIVSDNFGVHHLSSNWGYIALSPAPFGNLFTIRVGSIYDSHVKDGYCMGAPCFRSAFPLHIWVTVIWLAGLGLLLRRYPRAPLGATDVSPYR